MKLAIIHDWLLGMRGGERCLEAICMEFPGADIYTMFYRPGGISAPIKRHRIMVSSLQLLPGVASYYRYLLPFFWVGSCSLSHRLKKEHQREKYDLVISVSHCIAKNVRVPDGVPHLCYCLTPMRYLWDQYDSYFRGHPLEWLMRRIVPLLRRWDVEGSKRVNRFCAISEFVRASIRYVYRSDAAVVYPPVATDWIVPRREGASGEGFLCVSALVPYKNLEIIIRAFNRLPYQLTIVGSGPGEKALREIAGRNITILSKISDEKLARLYRSARALVFAAEEDFGMAPVEAQAAGRPVICYARGGLLETVRGGEVKPTGVYFSQLTEDALLSAIREFVRKETEFSAADCVRNARRFSSERFYSDFHQALRSIGFAVPDWEERRAAGGA